MERGVEPPDWIEDQPLSMPGDEFYLKAFWDLSTERQLGFTPGPIPASAIQVYAGAKGLPSSMMGLFETVVRSMDRTYLKWAESIRKKSSSRDSESAQSGSKKRSPKS